MASFKTTFSFSKKTLSFSLSISFFLRTRKNDSGLFGIYGRLIINRKKSDFAIGFRVRKEDWDEVKCLSKILPFFIVSYIVCMLHQPYSY